MIRSPSDEISRILALMPDCWKDDHKLIEATRAARVNRALALDQAPSGSSLDADIHRFFNSSKRGDQAMPMTTPSAAMPASLSPDNFTSATGGRQFARRNHGSDQAISVEELLRLIQQTMVNWRDQEVDAFVGGLNKLLGGNGEEPGAEDQFSPMQFSNGSGTAPHELVSPEQTMSATFAERDDLTSPRATADSARPRTARDRRRMAQDSIDQRYWNAANFSARFPFVQVECWR